MNEFTRLALCPLHFQSTVISTSGLTGQTVRFRVQPEVRRVIEFA